MAMNLKFSSDRVDGVAGTATALASSETLVREVTIFADHADVVLGGSDIVFSAATRHGLLIPNGTDVTIRADDIVAAQYAGMDGPPVINLADLYFDVATNDQDIYWFAIGF